MSHARRPASGEVSRALTDLEETAARGGLTVEQPPLIDERLLERAARAMMRLAGVDGVDPAAYPGLTDRYADLARAALTAALDGMVVVTRDRSDRATALGEEDDR